MDDDDDRDSDDTEEDDQALEQAIALSMTGPTTYAPGL